MITYLLIFLAAFFNAVMDACENENFEESILKKWDRRFWYKRDSWKYTKKIIGYRPDAWHLSKSLMIICFVLAVIFYEPKHEWWVVFISCGIIWNVAFWLFYNKLFGIK